MNQQLTLFNTPEHILDEEIKQKYQGKPRINVPVRNQVEIITSSIDDLISADHKVRFVWDYVQNLDMSGFVNKIKAVEGNAGRSAIDPHLL